MTSSEPSSFTCHVKSNTPKRRLAPPKALNSRAAILRRWLTTREPPESKVAIKDFERLFIIDRSSILQSAGQVRHCGPNFWSAELRAAPSLSPEDRQPHPPGIHFKLPVTAGHFDRSDIVG